MIGHFTIKTKYLDPEISNPFVTEIIKLSGKPVAWEYCKALEKLGYVEVLNKCYLAYQYPHRHIIRNKLLELNQCSGKEERV